MDRRSAPLATLQRRPGVVQVDRMYNIHAFLVSPGSAPPYDRHHLIPSPFLVRFALLAVFFPSRSIPLAWLQRDLVLACLSFLPFLQPPTRHTTSTVRRDTRASFLSRETLQLPPKHDPSTACTPSVPGRSAHGNCFTAAPRVA